MLRCDPLALCSLLLCTLFVAAPSSFADARRIIVDGAFDDWGTATGITDPVGDVPTGGAGVDFVSLRGANDERSLFLEITLAQPRLLQDGNDITLYLDTDLERATGLVEGDLGAELTWCFGQRVGTNFTVSGPQRVVIGDIGLRVEPVLTSTRFELAIPRDLTLFGQRCFTREAVRVSIRGNYARGDRMPDQASLLVRWSDESLPALSIIPVEKVHAPAIRVVTWNTHLAGVFDKNRQKRFQRILPTLQPDILILQEMWDRSRQTTRNLIASWLSYAPTWNVVVNDLASSSVLLSRYPVRAGWNLNGTVDATAALLDTRETLGREILVIAAHLSCCNNDAARDEEVKHIAAFIQDARSPGGLVTIPRHTPLIVLGDLNLVGKAGQLTTLLEGDLRQGRRQPPDWDDTPLAQLVPRHNAAPETYTWRTIESGIRFAPGRLDYVLYTDSVLVPLRQFVFQTASLPAEQLAQLNLTADDILQASDHAPVVADFVPAVPVLKIDHSAVMTRLTVYLTPERVFQVQHSDNLIDWINLASNLRTSTEPVWVVDEGHAHCRFYRAVCR